MGGYQKLCLDDGVVSLTWLEDQLNVPGWLFFLTIKAAHAVLQGHRIEPALLRVRWSRAFRDALSRWRLRFHYNVSHSFITGRLVLCESCSFWTEIWSSMIPRRVGVNHLHRKDRTLKMLFEESATTPRHSQSRVYVSGDSEIPVWCLQTFKTRYLGCVPRNFLKATG